jgi:hypothetical protein
MLASNTRGHTADSLLEAEHGRAYGFDPEFDGLEPLFHNVENGDQNNNFPRHLTASNPYLESGPMSTVVEFNGQNVEKEGKGLHNSVDEQEFEVLRDHQDSLHPSVAVSMQLSNCFDQNSKWQISERNSSKGKMVVMFYSYMMLYPKC